MTSTSCQSSIGNLNNLVTLNVASNALNGFPQTIANLKWLNHLDASMNNISHIESLCQLARLHDLFLLGNKLCEVPSCIGQLSQLKRFSAASNVIRDIPSSIGDARGLRDLYFDGNEITAAA